MTELATLDAYGVLTEPATLKIERMLPGPIERVWSYLTQSDLRRKWLAAGDMKLEVGATFELVWRNNDLTNPPGHRPPGFGDEHRLQSTILAVDPPRRLSFTFGNAGDVTFELTPKGRDVLFTVIHRRIPDRSTMLKVSAGWHTHLDVLAARAAGREPHPYWDSWTRLHGEYDKRLPA
jgi:uncharacterized protein YndB with AHSA1/START domain